MLMNVVKRERKISILLIINLLTFRMSVSWVSQVYKTEKSPEIPTREKIVAKMHRVEFSMSAETSGWKEKMIYFLLEDEKLKKTLMMSYHCHQWCHDLYKKKKDGSHILLLNVDLHFFYKKYFIATSWHRFSQTILISLQMCKQI